MGVGAGAGVDGPEGTAAVFDLVANGTASSDDDTETGAVADGAGAVAGLATGCTEETTGEAVDDALETGRTLENAGLAPGGGGRGKIPTPLLSLAAAAAAAEAYLSVSPGRRVGSGAGFMPGVALDEADGWRVARTGSGDFICVDGRRCEVESAFTGFGFDSGSSS